MKLVICSALCFTWKHFYFYDIKYTAAEGVPGMAEMKLLEPDPVDTGGGIG